MQPLSHFKALSCGATQDRQQLPGSCSDNVNVFQGETQRTCSKIHVNANITETQSSIKPLKKSFRCGCTTYLTHTLLEAYPSEQLWIANEVQKSRALHKLPVPIPTPTNTSF